MHVQQILTSKPVTAVVTVKPGSTVAMAVLVALRCSSCSAGTRLRPACSKVAHCRVMAATVWGGRVPGRVHHCRCTCWAEMPLRRSDPSMLRE